MMENPPSFTKPYAIVVSGSVGSGKSTVSAALSKALEDVPVLAFDHYEQYVEWPRDIAQWMNDGADPKHIRVPKLKEDLLALLYGKAITDPLTAKVIVPSRYIILQEPSGRGRQDIREYIDLAAHIDVPQDICVTRVVERVMNMEVWNSKGTFQGESRKDLV